jgi:hypothetical protein
MRPRVRHQPMVALTSLPPFQARLLAARLGAEGILWQLRGASQVYPFAPVDVLVSPDEVERAREVLLLAPLQPREVEAGFDPPADPGSDPGSDPESDPRSGVGSGFGVDPGADHAVHNGDAARRRPRRALRTWMVWLAIGALVLALCLQVSHWG